ncbi:MAG: rhomboid family intramembrane serine protease [Planctomycetota bacterium]
MTPDGGSGSMVCPACGRVIARNAMTCPYCDHVFPGLFATASWLDRFFAGRISYTRIFFGLNVLLYALLLIAMLRGGGLLSTGGSILAFLGPDDELLYKAGAHMRGPVVEGQWWRLFMAVFLHAGILHIACNMWALLALGPVVEHVFGHARFVLIYLGSGLAGNLAWQLFSGRSMEATVRASVGASGAIFGLVAALAVFGYRRGGLLGLALMRRMLVWAALMLAFGWVAEGVNNWAHGGGAVGGALLAAVLGIREQAVRGESQRVRLLALAGLAAGVAAFILTIVAALAGPTLKEAKSRSVFLWHEDEAYAETERMLRWAERHLPAIVPTSGELGTEETLKNALDSLLKVARVVDYWVLAGRRADPEADPAPLAEGLRKVQRLLQEGRGAEAAGEVERLMPLVTRMLEGVARLRLETRGG